MFILPISSQTDGQYSSIIGHIECDPFRMLFSSILIIAPCCAIGVEFIVVSFQEIEETNCPFGCLNLRYVIKMERDENPVTYFARLISLRRQILVS